MKLKGCLINKLIQLKSDDLNINIKNIDNGSINTKNINKESINIKNINSDSINYILHSNCKYYKNIDKMVVVKKYNLTKRKNNPKEFYEPCYHGKGCTGGKCKCVDNLTFCQLTCDCTVCDNIKYCNCIVCDSDCRCIESNRECSELCNCFKKCNKIKESNIENNNSLNFMKYFNSEFIKSFSKPKNCGNRNILNQPEYKLVVNKSIYHGYGLFTESKIPNNSYVIEYTGEIISDREAERRGNFYEMNKCSYLFNLANQGDDCLYSIDAIFFGAKSRYINHSKSRANLKAEVLSKDGMQRIVFYAIKDICAGEELLFDYHFTEEHKKVHGLIE